MILIRLTLPRPHAFKGEGFVSDYENSLLKTGLILVAPAVVCQRWSKTPETFPFEEKNVRRALEVPK
jgi:hypothetical protein